jgi:hypothetical protein
MGVSLSIPTQRFQYASIFAMFLPVAYVLVGILADVIAQQFKESISSVAAIVGVLVNKLISMGLVKFLGSTTQKLQENISYDGNISTLYTRVYRGCTVPGFEDLESIVAPQSFVIIFSLFFYFLTTILVSNPGQSVSGLVGLTAVALLIQGLFISTNGCWKSEYYTVSGYYMILPVIFSAVIGSIVGLSFGFATPAILSSLPNNGGSSNKNLLGSTGPVTAPSSDSALPPVGGSTGGSSGGTSDDNQFVCEAYKNGELITSTIAE